MKNKLENGLIIAATTILFFGLFITASIYGGWWWLAFGALVFLGLAGAGAESVGDDRMP